MWLALARESALPAPGSFITQEIGAERVLVVRGADRTVRGFFNVCRHRGSRLVEETSGTLSGGVRCPYHGWSYGLDGKLVSPRLEERLAEFAVDCSHGFLFFNLGEKAGKVKNLPDLSSHPLSDLHSVRRIEYDVVANWKVICENYSECYHCPLVHPQLDRISDRLSGSFVEGEGFNGGPMGLRTGFTTLSASGVSAIPSFSTLKEKNLVRYFLIYPNFMIGLAPNYVVTHTAWPLAVDRTRVVCEFLFASRDVPAPELVDIVDFWDLTNRQDWALCERVQRGVGSRGHAPGQLQAAEQCVQAFDRWYSERLLRS